MTTTTRIAAIIEYFEYLDELRVSGETNMFGAAAYLMDDFGIGRDKARAMLSAWMETFDQSPAEERAAKAQFTITTAITKARGPQ